MQYAVSQKSHKKGRAATAGRHQQASYPQGSYPQDRMGYLIIWAYTAVILFAELIGGYRNPLLALIAQALLLLLLVSHSVLHRSQPVSRVLLVLSLLPLLRLLSFTAITSLVPTIYLYILVATPLAIAIFLVARVHKLSWVTIGLHKVPWKPEVAIALSGLPLSLVGYWLLHPTPLLTRFALPPFIIAAIILTVFAAAVEELLFRGLLQQSARPLFGGYAIAYSSLIYAISYISWQSVGYVGFALLLGLYFGWCVRRTGALWGVITAHSVINIGMLLLWPLVL